MIYEKYQGQSPCYLKNLHQAVYRFPNQKGIFSMLFLQKKKKREKSLTYSSSWPLLIPSCRQRTKRRVAALKVNERPCIVEKSGHQSSRVLGAQHRFYIQITEAIKLTGP